MCAQIETHNKTMPSSFPNYADAILRRKHDARELKINKAETICVNNARPTEWSPSAAIDSVRFL